MQSILVLLIMILVNLGTSICWAEEVLTGRVVSLDRENGKIALRLMDGQEQLSDMTGKILSQMFPDLLTRESLPLEITVMIAKERLPFRLRSGEVVRVWGDFEKETGRFTARKLYHMGARGFSSDPTGVRRRLCRGCGRHRGMRGGSRGHGGR